MTVKLVRGILGAKAGAARKARPRGRPVVARVIGIVIERVLRAFVHVLGVALVGRLQGRFKGLDPLVDVVVHAGILQQQRSLDGRHLLGRGLRPIIGDLWCNTVPAQLVVVDDTITIILGRCIAPWGDHMLGSLWVRRGRKRSFS
jgi:hypothetical protein